MQNTNWFDFNSERLRGEYANAFGRLIDASGHKMLLFSTAQIVSMINGSGPRKVHIGASLKYFALMD